MRALSAVATAAVLICASAPAFADAQSHVQAAKKAERRGEWRKALEAWKAAYASDVNAEYLIGIGDAYSHLGNKAEAKKNYEAYLADPLALPANVAKVKTKIAGLDNPAAGALALPGPGLDLPGASAAPPPLPGGPGLDLPAAPVAEKKGKHKKGADAPMALPGLELPGAPPAQVAEKKPEPMLSLPGLDLPVAPAPSKKQPEKKVASAEPALELPGLPLPAAPPAKVEKKEPPAVAMTPPPVKPAAAGTAVAAATPPARTSAPAEALGSTRPTRPVVAASSGGSNTLAWVTAGIAVVGLGGGAFFYSQAASNHSDLTGTTHDGVTAQSLLDKEKSNKTLSFVGFATGLVAAGVATALFAF